VAQLSDGTFCLNYELIISNAIKTEVNIESIEIVDPTSADLKIGELKKAEIQENISLPAATQPTTTLAPGQAGYLRINLAFSQNKQVPSVLEHVISLAIDKPYRTLLSHMSERVARAEVCTEQKVVIGPPLKGKDWVAVAVGKDSYHRKAIMPLNGRWFAPERWAVDWIQLTDENRLVTGDPAKNESYPQYGKEIIAVSDGIIISVRDDLADTPPGKLPENITLQDAAGNCIVQDIGGGYSALYAHLKPGSIRVKKGQRVRRGQVIALLGNSGNTDAPHLHFHVIKGKLPLVSDGVPYVIDSFILKTQAVSSDFLETEFKNNEIVKIEAVKNAGKRHKEMPQNLAIVEFP
jgi:hypothetical protein